jgi:hypothetical protein
MYETALKGFLAERPDESTGIALPHATSHVERRVVSKKNLPGREDGQNR